MDREYRNPLMWIFFGKSIKKQINNKNALIAHFENILNAPVI